MSLASFFVVSMHAIFVWYATSRIIILLDRVETLERRTVRLVDRVDNLQIELHDLEGEVAALELEIESGKTQT